MYKALVTGSDGFIGSHLVESLVKEGIKVKAFCFYNSNNSWGWLDKVPQYIKKEIDVFLGDIRDPYCVEKAMRGCDTVFHLAALIAIPYSYEAPSSYVDTNVAVAITPTAADSHYWIQAYVAHGVQHHDAQAVFNIKDSATGNNIFADPGNGSSGTNDGYMSNCWSHGSDGSADNYHVGQTFVGGMYNPASDSSSARTFTVRCKTHQQSGLEIRINGVSESGQTGHMIQHSSYIEVWEIANGLYS